MGEASDESDLMPLARIRRVITPWITAISVPHLLRAVALVGGAPDRLAARFDPPRDPRYEDRIPISVLCDLWEAAIEQTGRRDLSAVAAANVVRNERSLIGFAVSNQLRLGEGVERIDRYYPTVSNGYKWRCAVDEQHLRIEASPPGPVHRVGWQAYLEFEAIDMIRNGLWVTEGQARPAAARYVHAAPDCADGIASAHGVDVEFSAPTCEIVWPRSVLDLPIPGAQPQIARRIEEQLDAMMDALSRDRDATARVRRSLPALMRAGTADVARIARAVGMSRRSLERALEAEGTSVGTLIQEERVQLALTWLPQMSVDEVAERLGYSDARAFSRAFRRWTGRAPSERRRR
jgi:AraC-like DNA-binding protein